nr:type II toxin-antitoxin system VapB family antitoxin [Nocardioides agariphilus]
MTGRIAFVPTLNIKDPEVYRLAAELAERRHTSMTDAVRQALDEAITKARADRAAWMDSVMELAAQWRAAGGTVVPDEEMYDENGLPMW